MQAPQGDDLQRVKQAAEEASWLLARGYATSDVQALVSTHRALSDDERTLLECSARCSANMKHHIARELDPEDVRKRTLKIDTESLLCCAAGAALGVLLIESSAGLLCDPTWVRGVTPFGQTHAAALENACGALKTLKPKDVCWLVRSDWEAPLSAALGPLAKTTKLKVEVVAADVVAKLDGSAFVVSNDPRVLDRCGTWLNLLPLFVAETERLSLD
jgi:hypothetical protein